ncbi:hypothetical protein H0B56_12875 [Haloechinothrix sp. YIM 98757]|uniref:Uncharacterized protein n=1 Tax=Haloechinothrix aidingensis TaxID=2752311 RepID=A0A838AB44_9PSEU|nr:hypothetical protein [Haloechinothrix aidingensis]MBA0126436.1 hypothetical protein [Haloechinothrix aidingensis]
MTVPDHVPGEMLIGTAVRGFRDQMQDALAQPEPELREQIRQMVTYLDELADAVDRTPIRFEHQT